MSALVRLNHATVTQIQRRNRNERQPATRSAKRDLSRVGLGRGIRGSKDADAAEAPYSATSSQTALGPPTAATTTPAIAGPASLAADWADANIPFTACRRSRGTTAATSEVMVGNRNPREHPTRT